MRNRQDLINVSAGPNTDPSGTVRSLIRDTRSQLAAVAVGNGVLVGVRVGVEVGTGVIDGVTVGVSVFVAVDLAVGV